MSQKRAWEIAAVTVLTITLAAAALNGVGHYEREQARTRLPGRLGFAAAQGDVAEVQALLARGAPQTQLGNEGRTALHGAVSMRRIEAARVLLEAGADANLGGGDAVPP